MEEKDRKFLRAIGTLSTAVLTPVFAVGIGFFLGLKMDHWLGTSPWFTGMFIVLGLIAGFREVYRSVKRGKKMMDEDDGNKHD